MVTDGEDSGSRYGVHHTRLAAHAAGVPLFHVAVSGRPPSLAGPSSGRGPIRRGGSSSIEFDRVVEETGGTRIVASSVAYEQLLNHLRGFYVVGYYVPRPEPNTAAEIQRHELKLASRRDNTEVLYPHVGYRPTIDHVRVETEIAEARRQLAAGDLAAARFAAGNAVAANPDWGPAYAVRAEALARLEFAEEASADALTAASLTPGDAPTHHLAAHLAFDAGQPLTAWEQAIRAAQAGADMNDLFDIFGRIARSGATPPGDLLTRTEAPRVALVVGASVENDVFARAALSKAMLAVGRALSDAPLIALTRAVPGADFIVRVSDKNVGDETPRRFRGQITVTTTAGDEIYDEGFTLDDLDDATSNAADLAKHVREIGEKIARAQR